MHLFLWLPSPVYDTLSVGAYKLPNSYGLKGSGQTPSAQADSQQNLHPREGSFNQSYRARHPTDHTATPHQCTAQKAELSYGQVAYYELMQMRTNLLLKLLQNDVSFMLLESDAYWAKNALKEIADLKWPEYTYDMISASDEISPVSALQGKSATLVYIFAYLHSITE